MTQLRSISSIRILSGQDVRTVLDSLTPKELMHSMRSVFSSLSSADSDLVQPERTTIQSASHASLFMPSRIAPDGTGIKVVSVPRLSGDTGGLPGTTLLLEEGTGRVEAVVNSRHLTAIRNAAGSALATHLAGVTSPSSIVLFGAGAQISAHATILLEIYPTIQKCTIVNRSDNARLSTLTDQLVARFAQVSFRRILLDDRDSVEPALSDADIVCTATSSTNALFDDAWLNPAAHLNLVGSYTPKMREVTSRLIDNASLIIVDSIDACSKEAGELQSTKVDRMVELGTLCLKNDPYRRLERRRTVFKSVGVGIQDVAIARLVLKKAETVGVGAVVPYDEWES